MAGNNITISTDEVEQIASELEKLNDRLNATLNHSKQTITNLSNIWHGDAMKATVESYNSFAQKYFQNYREILEQYVKFLRQNVVHGYLATEDTNISLADAFK